MHHVAHFLVYNVLAKFQLFCIITCRDILYFVFWLPYCHTLWRHQYLICIIQKSWISLERDEIWQKGKCHSSSLFKGLSNKPFFNSSIFHFIGTLNKVYSLKGPSQPHLCFSLHARIWRLYFIRSLSKWRKITVKLLKIIKHTFRNTAYSKTIKILFIWLYQ